MKTPEFEVEVLEADGSVRVIRGRRVCMPHGIGLFSRSAGGLAQSGLWQSNLSALSRRECRSRWPHMCSHTQV